MLRKEDKKYLDKYFTPEYDGKDIIITNDFPNRILILSNYILSNTNVPGYVVKITKHRVSYYDIEGKPTKNHLSFGYGFCDYIIEGEKATDLLEFFKICHHFYVGKSFKYNVLKCIFYDSFREFINELNRNQIKTEGLIRFMNPSDFKKFTNEQFLKITDIFKWSPKDLRALSLNPEVTISHDNCIHILTKLFNTSVRNIVDYVPLYWNAAYSLGLNNVGKNRKKAIRDLQYLRLLSNNNLSLQVYLDYRRTLVLLKYYYNITSFPKYPKDINKIVTLHDEAMLLYSLEGKKQNIASAQELNDKYKNIYKKVKKYNYSNENYTIFACKNLLDLVKEGRELNHCISSYTNSVADGKEYILFLRKTKNPDKSFYTVDMLPNKRIKQIHGHSNVNITEEVELFVEEWANKFDLDTSGMYNFDCPEE